ncbi:sensor histidine kinase [Anaerocolumna aminovalerica]|uniref:histidine kinase n=1 Tax=Anaerocolumna aminovalerica TaxID=1527 RepID=A0A1I5FNK2_9FIRM|nr:HAMP domain-containing sensor histidine kinase [Anaerocolumna aminovalerica]SFO25203.1 His Kinase A (phospho-acceptor) domain-containing protein [Anaerocolumna aminovalerica]
MERIRNMSLKKSFFTITILFLTVAFMLSIASIAGCVALRDSFFKSGQFTVDFGSLSTDMKTQYTPLNNDWRIQALNVLQLILPIFFVILSLFLADIFFYRIKLKKPLSVLQRSAERIQGQDLDFTVKKYADDELGTLCTAFETMRTELLKNNQELWRQMEERKRLNAAFSHDLRNPVTVLKGSAKILQKALGQDSLTVENAKNTISLITQYTGRIETYVEAMTSAQKLEELKCSPQSVDWGTLCNHLENSLSIISKNTGKKFNFSCHGEDRQIWIDPYILQNTAENLIDNALRYAKKLVWVHFSYEQDRIVLEISDDGPGFSSIILHKGATPFLRDDNATEQEHFGMGLYICRLLCEKHGGNLTLENTPTGAKAIAAFHILKP